MFYLSNAKLPLKAEQKHVMHTFFSFLLDPFKRKNDAQDEVKALLSPAREPPPEAETLEEEYVEARPDCEIEEGRAPEAFIQVSVDLIGLRHQLLPSALLGSVARLE